MKKAGILSFSLLLAGLAFAAPPDPKLEGFPRLALYGGLSSVGGPLINADRTMDMNYARKMARFPTIVLPILNLTNRPGIADTLRMFNPNIRILGYQLGMMWFLDSTTFFGPTDTNFTAKWHAALQATHGFRSDCCPGPGDACEADWAQADVAEALTQLLEYAAIGKMDGIFIDFFGTILGDGAPCSSPTPEDSFRTQTMRATVHRVRQASKRQDFLFCGNTNDHVKSNGGMREGFPDEFVSSSFVNVKAWQDAGGTGHMDILKGVDVGTQFYFSTATPGRVRFVHGTAALLGIRGHVGPQNINDPEPGYMRWWFDEYAVRIDPNLGGVSDTTGQYVGWLGQPIGPATAVAFGWRRDFENGIVLVNPGLSPLTFDVGEPHIRRILGFRDPAVNNGKYDRTFVVPSKDALFLVRQNCCANNN